MNLEDLKKDFPKYEFGSYENNLEGFIYTASRPSTVYKAVNLKDLYDFLTGAYHSEECWKAMEKRFDEIDKWIKDNPNYCRHCGGWGGFESTYDPSPGGVGLSPGYYYDYDLCPECCEKGICPRCGELIINPEDMDGEPLVCKSCGWDEEDNNRGIPYQPECCCYRDEEDLGLDYEKTINNFWED